MALFLSAIVYRLIHLQIIEHDHLRAESNHQETYTADTHLARGSIYFTTKEGNLVSAATLDDGYTLALVPAEVESVEALQAALDTAGVSVSRERIESRMRDKKSQFAVIAEKVSRANGHTLEAMHIPGLVITPSSWRAYPGGSLAAQVVGFVGFNGDVREGRTGIERQFNDVLSRDERALTTNFFADLFQDASDVVADKPLEGNVITSIEPSAQAELERILAATQSQWQSTDTLGIIMNAHTGEIVALAQTPTFNPNDYGAANGDAFKNTSVESVYEMGSIMKVLTFASGIDSGVITEGSTYNDVGTVTRNGKTFGNFDGKARGVVSVKEVLRQSLNVGAAHIADLLGRDAMRAYFLEKFRLGEETGVDLPGEIPGIVRNIDATNKHARDIEFATASFGQGIATTPLATLRALTAVANGGTLVVPHVVTAVQYPGGIVKSINYSDQAVSVLKPGTSEIVSRVLASIVDEKLKNGSLKLEHYTVAAKTGTAQMPKPGGGYYTDRYMHTFFGYVPAFDPQYVVLLAQRYPKNAKYSSETLSAPFIDVVKFLVNFYSVRPDR